jgi:hypothetical protein
MTETQICWCLHFKEAHRGSTEDDDGMCHVRGCVCETFRSYPKKVVGTFVVTVEYDPTDWPVTNFEPDNLMGFLDEITRKTEGGDVRDVQWSVEKVEVVG